VRICGRRLFVVITEQESGIRRVGTDEFASRIASVCGTSLRSCQAAGPRRLERWMSHLRNLT
jgi:hypothetical protein